MSSEPHRVAGFIPGFSHAMHSAELLRADVVEQRSVGSVSNVSLSGLVVTPPAADPSSSSSSSVDREQRITYLKQAICGFFKAKKSVEMQNLGRVICAILALDAEEQACVMESISRLAPAVAASSTLESISLNITSLFA